MSDVMKQVSDLERILLERLSENGFRKKRANVFIRKEKECTQHVSVLVTKTRGEDSAHIRPTVGFTYEAVNRIIYALQSKAYDSKRVTAHISMETLIDRKEPYDFYITRESGVSDIADILVNDIREYAFIFWESCNSYEKYYSLLREKNEFIRKSTYSLKRPEWNLLALALLLNQTDYRDILNEYKEDFGNNGFCIESVGKIADEYMNTKE
jgi:hypothetical protein